MFVKKIMIDRQGGRKSVERFFVERVFVEIEASWRESLRGEKVFKEIMSLWRDSSRRDSLRGEPGSLCKVDVHISLVTY